MEERPPPTKLFVSDTLPVRPPVSSAHVTAPRPECQSGLNIGSSGECAFWRLKKWTWFPLLELENKLLGRKNHVHQPTVPRLRHHRLPPGQPIVPGGPGDLPHRAAPRTPPLPPVRLGRGLGSRGRRTHLPYAAHRRQADVRAAQ